MTLRKQISRIGRLAAAMGGVAAIAGATPGIANAACAGGPESHPFAEYGDNANYVIAPGGTFESGTPGWSLNGARVVEGNETLASTGSHSLVIDAGGRAVTPPVCVATEYPTFRFFARQLSGDSGATLTASLRWINLLGIAVESPAGTVPASTSWAPSPVMRLGNSVPLWLPGGLLYVQVVFRTTAGSSWAIDDAYIDPYSR